VNKTGPSYICYVLAHFVPSIIPTAFLNFDIALAFLNSSPTIVPSTQRRRTLLSQNSDNLLFDWFFQVSTLSCHPKFPISVQSIMLSPSALARHCLGAAPKFLSLMFVVNGHDRSIKCAMWRRGHLSSATAGMKEGWGESEMRQQRLGGRSRGTEYVEGSDQERR
jgi:hypothetical protein